MCWYGPLWNPNCRLFWRRHFCEALYSLAEVQRIMSSSGCSRRWAGDVAGCSGIRGSNGDVGEPWAKETAVVYWDSNVPVNPPVKVWPIKFKTFSYIFHLVLFGSYAAECCAHL